MTESFDAIIVAGGRGERLGGESKPELVLGGRALLDISLDAVAGARAVVVVGGPRRDGVAWTVEEPPGSGPAAAVAAGVAALAEGAAPWTVVIAVDMPRVGVAVEPLLSARGGDGAWVVDGDGRPQPLLAVYRTATLAARATEPLANAPMRRLVAGLDMAEVRDAQGAARDVDTWDDVTYWKETLG